MRQSGRTGLLSKLQKNVLPECAVSTSLGAGVRGVGCVGRREQCGRRQPFCGVEKEGSNTRALPPLLRQTQERSLRRATANAAPALRAAGCHVRWAAQGSGGRSGTAGEDLHGPPQSLEEEREVG